MAKSVCPRCKEVILSFEDDVSIRCSKCETEFEVKGDLGDRDDVDKND